MFDETLWLLSQAIRATTLRHEVIARNLANIETPGFKAQDVEFQEVLRSALASRRDQGLAVETPWAPQAEIRLVRDTDGVPRQDGNTVDLEREMVKLTQNTLFHSALVQLLNAKLQILRMALQDRL